MADLIARGCQGAASYLKEHYSTERGKRQLDSLLSSLLKPSRNFDDDVSNWCLWLMAGGQTPEDFLGYLRSYNSSPICGLVWNANFVAYRCRDCGISPCMSLCADCFQNGNHEGHDFNMFRSQAGGACDCGDESVMRRQGFCAEHNPEKSFARRHPPEEYLQLSRSVVPKLFLKLYQCLKDGRYNVYPPGTENLFHLLNQLSEIDSLRDVMVDAMLSKVPCKPKLPSPFTYHDDQDELKPIWPPGNGRGIASSIGTSVLSHGSDFCTPFEDLSEDKAVDSYHSDERIEARDNSDSVDITWTYLEYFMNALIQLEFFNSLATFLLRLLPDQKYKVMFTRLFSRHYGKIGDSLLHTANPEDLSSRVVHVSVQLFSSEQLALQMVQEEALLASMCAVMVKMVQNSLRKFGFREAEETRVATVGDCFDVTLRRHRYWPIACDLINILSHKSVVEVFLSSDKIVLQWLYCVMYLTGINLNERLVIHHLEYESGTHHTAFLVEFESVAAIMWELQRGCIKLSAVITSLLVGGRNLAREEHRRRSSHGQTERMYDTFRSNICDLVIFLIPAGKREHCARMIRDLQQTLVKWMEMFPLPSRSIVSFHLSLHRYLALFLNQAICHFNMDPREAYPPESLISKMFEYPLRVLIAFYEIKAGYWVFNGHEIRFQAQSYVKSHFCNSMADLDIFFVQVAASVMDPDHFLKTLIDRFGLRNWFSFGTIPPQVDKIKEIALVEGLFHFILTIITHRVYSGADEASELRKDIAAQLCVHDRPHSKLSELVPGKPGESYICMKDFDTILHEIADYKSPTFDSDAMQQGTYAPKDFVWEKEFDFHHIQLRCYAKTCHQDALDRFSAYFVSKGLAATSRCWPYPRPFQPIAKAFSGLINLLHCKTLHQIVFCTLQKAVDDPSSVSENILISIIHLLYLCLETEKPEEVPTFCKVAPDHGVSIAVKCLDFLENFAPNERGLCIQENLDQAEMRSELFRSMMADDSFQLDPVKHSPAEVYRALLSVVFTVCYGALFYRMINYINDILGEVSSPGNKQTKVQIKLDKLQSILSLLPTEHYYLLKRILMHWMRMSRLSGIPVKDFSFPVPKKEAIAFTLLMTSLTRKFEWLFQIVTPKEGYPAHAYDIKFPSNYIVENATVEVNGDDGHACRGRAKMTLLTEDVPPELTNQLMNVIKCSKDKAIELLRKYDNNIEFAVCMVMDGQESVEDGSLEEADPQQAELPQVSGSMMDQCNDETKESLLSLLIRVRDQLAVLSSKTSTSSSGCGSLSALSAQTTKVVGDGSFFIRKLIHEFCLTSHKCALLVGQLCPKDLQLMDHHDANFPRPELAAEKLRKQRAAERQRQLIAEFARRQKLFIEKNFPDGATGHGDSMDVDEEDNGDVLKQELNCVICGISTQSTEERPFGLVILMQPTSNLGHRYGNEPSEFVEEATLVRSPRQTCLSVLNRRKKAILGSLEKVSGARTLELGLDCGVHMQTCGHYLHVDCQQSYFKALKEEQERDILQIQPVIFHADKGYYTCPLCRQIGNGFLPILPRALTQGNIEVKSGKNVEEDISRTLRKYAKKGKLSMLTARSLSFTVLTAAFSSLSDSVATLQKEGGALITSLYSDRSNKEKFLILVAALRVNFELAFMDKLVEESRQSARKEFLNVLVQGIHFASLGIENPMFDVWEQLKDPVSREVSSSSSETRPRSPMLLYDCASLLLQIYLTWPVVMTKDEYCCVVQHVFNLCLIEAVINICINLHEDERKQYEEYCPSLKSSCSDPDLSAVLGLVASCVASRNTNNDVQVSGITSSVLSPKAIEGRVQEFCLPFLRVASSVGYIRFNMDCPESTNDVQTEFFSLARATELHQGHSTATDSSLTWKSYPLRFSSCQWTNAVKCWCQQLFLVTPSRGVKLKELVPQPHVWQKPRLMQLPKSYDKLFDRYRKQKCSKCGRIPSDPTICLVCGAFLCYRSPCCKDENNVHECVRHSIECGCGTGVFLIISSSVVVIIRFDRGCIWGSVYLDSFGEEDRDLRRGKPLFLSQERFDRLEKQWAGHLFDRTCKRWGLHRNEL